MHETPNDLVRLQATLDASYETAGAHLREIITPERRVGAADLVERLSGMCLLVLATVTADGRPLNGPVDGFFYRGEWFFGSSDDSVRFKHIRRRPQVSATHMPEEAFSVTVHGRAHEIDLPTYDDGAFHAMLLDHYGAGAGDFLESGIAYARIEAERLFTFLLATDRAAAERRLGDH